jgi:hypothetical protein
MVKQKDIITIQDKNFSKTLLDLSSLRSCNITRTPFDSVIKAHGALVQDNNNNILFDLRLQSEKPFWGHSHPLIIKNPFNGNLFENNLKSFDLKEAYILNHLNFDKPVPPNKTIIQQNLVFSNKDSLQFLESSSDYYIEVLSDHLVKIKESFAEHEHSDLFNYINTALIAGKRVLEIQNTLKAKFPKLLHIGLLFIIEIDSSDIISKAQSYGIYLNKKNIDSDKLFLSLPTSFTKIQLSDLLNRLELFFGELKCL